MNTNTLPNISFSFNETEVFSLFRFGFVPCTSHSRLKPGAAPASFSTDFQYIHYTGNMFLLIPTQLLQRRTGIQGIKEDSSNRSLKVSVHL